jgi:hypothetical protein
MSAAIFCAAAGPAMIRGVHPVCAASVHFPLKEPTIMSAERETLCPSAQPDWEGARLFGVLGGTPQQPQTAYLDQAQPVIQEVLELAGPVAPVTINYAPSDAMRDAADIELE